MACGEGNQGILPGRWFFTVGTRSIRGVHMMHLFGLWPVAAGGLFLGLRALLLVGPAVQALRERYARGEIGEDEHCTRPRTLS